MFVTLTINNLSTDNIPQEASESEYDVCQFDDMRFAD